MNFILSNLPEAISCRNILLGLQKRFARGLEAFDESDKCLHMWFRNKGKNGGGERLNFPAANHLMSASINVSQVHYQKSENKNISSATALSSIIHPSHPIMPSLHMHISLMTKFDNRYYWRIMADLNPSIPNREDTDVFNDMLRKIAPNYVDKSFEVGNKYFYIPALDRCRGVSHFYLENHKTDNFDEDLRFAELFGMHVITTYLGIINSKKNNLKPVISNEKNIQLAYHTLYFFQVLLLDRGTTVGLLSHNENDLGILSSLPKFIDKNLLLSWVSRLPSPQDLLIERLIKVMPNTGVIEINTTLKNIFATIIREFYLEYPNAKEMQAESPIYKK